LAYHGSGQPAPNLIYPLDYRELDSEQQISSQGAVHVTLAGRMASSGTIAQVDALEREGALRGYHPAAGKCGRNLCWEVATGLRGNRVGFGNAYFLDQRN